MCLIITGNIILKQSRVNKVTRVHVSRIAVFSVLCFTTISHALPRSQGLNGARELVGWQSQINQWNREDNYGSFSVTPEFTKIKKYDNPLAGHNFIVDLNYYQGFDTRVRGLYFRIHTPLIYASVYNNISSNDYIPKDCISRVGFADITAALGKNFVRHERFLLGLNIRTTAPTGSKLNVRNYGPMIGNGHHWELGGGLDMWWVWWKSIDAKKNLTLYVDACATHMFKRREGPCKLPDQDVQVTYYVSFPFQSQVTLKLAHTFNNLQFDLGYEWWYRDWKKTERHEECLGGANCSKGKNLELHKDVRNIESESHYENNNSIFIDESKTDTSTWNSNSWNVNPNIDRPDFNDVHVTESEGWANVKTGIEDVFDKWMEYCLDVAYGDVAYHSNKLFFNLGYLWKEHEHLIPYLSVGGEIEYIDHSCCSYSCELDKVLCSELCGGNGEEEYHHKEEDCCREFTQWGIWIKGGFSF